MRKKHPDYPDQHFPLKPVTNYWNLAGRFGDEAVEIRRRGYGMVPNFSTTIDGATGRTIDKAIADLGDWKDVATPTRAMKGYIALSRVTRADDLVLAQVFSPCLFTQGKQHWPSLLLEVQRGAIAVDDAFPNLCEATEALSKSTKKLTDASFRCSSCDVNYPLSHFLNNAHANPEWYKEVQTLVLEKGSGQRICRANILTTLKCHSCGKEKALSELTASMLTHGKPSCKDCQGEAAEKRQCTTCAVCGKSKPNSEFSPSMLHHRATKDHRTLCTDCDSEPTHKCDLCGHSKTR